MNVHKMPVVKTSPPDSMRVHSESQGLNEMEGAPCGSAEPGDIARVRWYLGLYRHYTKRPESWPGSKPTRGDPDRGVF